uniref:Craniofacial development protein 2 n=1 Tax=Plectus sambesii TaxID=2011161 RepID=A0A914XGR0_9BILA
MKEGLVNIVSAYAPQTGCSSEEKADFWQLLNGMMQSVSAEEQVLVLGDLNGHLGMARSGYKQVHGGYAISNRNQEGEDVLAFMLTYDMALTNTYFKKKNEHLATYSSSGIKTQIIFCLEKLLCHNTTYSSLTSSSTHHGNQQG